MKAGLSKLLYVIGLLHFSFLGISQNKESADSLVRLIEAKSAHLIEKDSISYRKIVGPATFLHNNTYHKCDTALWNVNSNIIDAIGNIEILQENTRLTSDRIQYVVPQDLAKFRGSLVELMDRDGNILNTNYLDYNTKDSVATFFNGAAMRGKDGNVIESLNGRYAAKEKKFTFKDKVQIFTDSVFIVSSKVDYLTESDVVVFNDSTTAWREENILFANSGNFSRQDNVFTFNKDSYVLTKDQELWGDILKYYRHTGDADLYDNVQILDTVQSAICMADKVIYRPSQRRIELTEKPAVGMYFVENDIPDTLFLSADTIVYRAQKMDQIDSIQVLQAKERIKLSNIDPIANHDAERRAARGKKVETLPATDTTQVNEELPGPAKDTSDVIFIDAFCNVKFYRSDVQGVCDSLVYTGLDSMARFYERPAMWYNEVHQFVADSIQAIVKDKQLDKVNLLSNAFIAVQEDTVHYNQIKSTEMAAYFKDNQLVRFDALGGVTAIFYMEEDSTITLMDKEECKMLTAKIKDNQIQRTRSIEGLQQNVFPVFGLSVEDQRLKGFEWRGAERPVSRYEITSRHIRKSVREDFDRKELPEFKFTDRYFPDMMSLITNYRDVIIEKKKSILEHKKESQQ